MNSKGMLARFALAICAPALLITAIIGVPGQVFASHDPSISGTVVDSITGVPLDNVCVVNGPVAIVCWTSTNANGEFKLSLPEAAPSGSYQIQYFRTGYVSQSQTYIVDGAETVPNVLLVSQTPGQAPPTATQPPGLVNTPPPASATPPPSACGTADARTPTQTVYLPNITKTLGGAQGWQTPFIVQNIGTAVTDLEVSFFSFSTGVCVHRRTRAALAAGTSQAYSPNDLANLPADSQFAVVIRSFGSDIVSVVNQHQNVSSATRAEALSYNGFSSGATSVFLPNITRKFFGFVTPFIIQNLGTVATTATATFRNRATGATFTTARSVAPGAAQFVDPNSEPGLADGAYSVTVTSAQPIAVVVNTHQIGVPEAISYSTNGLSIGAPNVYGPYAAKNAQGVQRLSTIVVQNLGTTPTTPSLTFTPLGGVGTPQTFTSPSPVAPGEGWAFDPRFTVGTTVPCSTPSATCLGDGEYSFVATAVGGSIAAAVNVISLSSPATAMGYTAQPAPAPRFFLPNVTRTLGGSAGWTTPILLQTVTAGGAVLRWYRFSDGQLVHTQTVVMNAGTGARIDPRNVSGLTDDTQYAVVIEGSTGTVAAIVIELASGADNAMIYEGFPSQ